MHWPNDLDAHNIEITTSQIVNMNFQEDLNMSYVEWSESVAYEVPLLF